MLEQILFSNLQRTIRSRRGVAAAALAMIATLAAPLAAQTTSSESVRPLPTRAELEAQAASAERIATSNGGDAKLRQRKRAEAIELRERLREGDFRVGDRILVTVRGDSTLSDTLTVRAGKMVELPNIQPISLDGVLRSELQDYLSKQIGKYVREPDVHATALIRVAVLGPVARPGFYSVASDMLVSDAIMAAGGPSTNADITKTVIRRGTQEIGRKEEVQAALTQGTTLDQLNFRSGDELVVGEKSARNWERVARVVGLVSGLALSAFYLLRSF